MTPNTTPMDEDTRKGAARTVRLYPWFKFGQSLIFWQAIWFLYFQQELSGAEAILLYAIYDIGTTVLEVPSGYMSDRIGRRFTLIAAALAGIVGMALLGFGEGFLLLALGQLIYGASIAFTSGTDTSLLYESLRMLGRERDVERQELRAWRFGFTGFALSAVSGGALALADMALPFVVTGIVFVAVFGITLLFREPRTPATGADQVPMGVALKAAFREPVLGWLFLLSVLMYVFSHLPFVFGQPFILEVLSPLGLAQDAPLVSGAITAAMMVISLGASVIAARMRAALGLVPLLLSAFALQVVVIYALTVSASVALIFVLLLRMVPDSLSKPFILARTQPLLDSSTRATYLSLQGFVGRLAFAGSLALAAGSAPAASALPIAQIQMILTTFAAVGLGFVVLLALWSRWLQIEPR